VIREIKAIFPLDRMPARAQSPRAFRTNPELHGKPDPTEAGR
jgi:hypothetical protein